MGVSKNSGTPKWMVKIMENPKTLFQMDDLGVPLFLETSICYSSQPAWPQNLRLFHYSNLCIKGCIPAKLGVSLFSRAAIQPPWQGKLGKTGKTRFHFLAQGRKLRKKHFKWVGATPNCYYLRGEFRYGKWSSRLHHNQQLPSFGCNEKMKCLGTMKRRH